MASAVTSCPIIKTVSSSFSSSSASSSITTFQHALVIMIMMINNTNYNNCNYDKTVSVFAVTGNRNARNGTQIYCTKRVARMRRILFDRVAERPDITFHV